MVCGVVCIVRNLVLLGIGLVAANAVCGILNKKSASADAEPAD